MEKTQAYKRIQELTELINDANKRYYVDNAPTISDYEFDMLMKELESLEKDYPDLMSADSPTGKVGSDLFNPVPASGSIGVNGPKREFEQYPHRYPMLSLANTYDISEIQAFADRVAKGIGNVCTFSCELKFDGTAICLTYRNGRLYRALTRGDGTVGDDVTENVKRISNIPQVLKMPADFTPTRSNPYPWPKEFEIRGEIYMPWEAFDRLNEVRIKEEETPFANPRNAASGSLKLIDSNAVAERGLECTLYHVLGEDLNFQTHAQALDTVASWGLPVSDKRNICTSIEDIRDFITYWDTERKNLPFATDGIVIKVNEIPYHTELGYTSKVPRWAVAYKFKAEQALTRLVSIDYQVGRTGAVTPVANLEPVQLSGTVVKRASLHNSDQMHLLDIHIGDYVYVEKGGEIIPKITGVDPGRRSPDAARPHFPEFCPDCGTPLVKDEAEARSFCPNQSGCPTQIKGKLVHFLSRKAMNVIAGDATIDQLYTKGLVWNIADFYELTTGHLLMLDGWKERSAERFLKSLEESLDTPFEKVLYALGIRHIGETTAKSLARHFGNIDTLASASREELLEMNDIGEVIADSIQEWFADEMNLETVSRLKAAGLKFTVDTDEEKLSAALDGCTIVISGNFSISRDQIRKLIESHGGKSSGSISGKTTYLLAGEKAGPEKLKKAESLGTSVISEEEFMNMIGRTPQNHDQMDQEYGMNEQLTLFD